MDYEKRIALIDRLANHYTESVDLNDLMQFFYDAQVEYLDDVSDEELVNLCEETGMDYENE